MKPTCSWERNHCFWRQRKRQIEEIPKILRNGLWLLLCFTVKVTQELCLQKGWHVNPGDVYPDYLRFCQELQLFLSSCYYSWAYSQSICRFRLYAEEANGWIQRKMTHCPMLCQNHWWLSLTAIDMAKCLERCPTQLHSRLCWNAIIIRTSKYKYGVSVTTLWKLKARKNSQFRSFVGGHCEKNQDLPSFFFLFIYFISIFVSLTKNLARQLLPWSGGWI